MPNRKLELSRGVHAGRLPLRARRTARVARKSQWLQPACRTL